MRTIPGLLVLNPGDPVSIRKATLALAKHSGPSYMRIGSPNMPVLYDEDLPFEIGKGILVREGHDVTLIGTGTVLCQAVKAAQLLDRKGISARVIDIHSIKPLDEDMILKAAGETGRIVTVEEHFLNGGLGSAIAQFLSQTRPTPVKMLGIDDRFASNGPYEGLLGQHGLLAEQIAASSIEFLKKKF